MTAPEHAARAVIMAGGRGSRMSTSGAQAPKPLVRIRGVTMLERNLLMLLASGFRDIIVVAGAQDREVQHAVNERCAALCEALGATVGCHLEHEPRGTIGAVADVAGACAAVLVVNADNLTSLDLAHLVAHHLDANAAMTVAVHEEPFPIPFAAVDSAEGQITRYTEKPSLPVSISSGTYVLGSTAVQRIPRTGNVAAPDLVNDLLRAGARIAEHRHDAAWIDVNHLEAVVRAEELVASCARLERP